MNEEIPFADAKVINPLPVRKIPMGVSGRKWKPYAQEHREFCYNAYTATQKLKKERFAKVYPMGVIGRSKTGKLLGTNQKDYR